MNPTYSISSPGFRLVATAYGGPWMYIYSLVARGIRALWPAAGAASVPAAFGLMLCGLIVGAGMLGEFYDKADTLSTARGVTESVKLPDGSVAQLAPLTSLRVHYSDRIRSVTLIEGEAYFEVTHDASRPFQVRLGNSVVRAEGTALDVSKRRGGISNVVVAEGRVAVFNWPFANVSTLPESSIRLPAGHSLPLAQLNASQIIEVDGMEMRRRMAWRDGRVVSSGEPLGSLVERLNLFSRQKLVVVDPALARLEMAGSFNAKDVDGIVKQLEALGIRGERVTKDGVEEIRLSR